MNGILERKGFPSPPLGIPRKLTLSHKIENINCLMDSYILHPSLLIRTNDFQNMKGKHANQPTNNNKKLISVGKMK